ncbi:hypothetical protein I4U23_027324 [Adineta vaga]|nr:hypothetical protein I4U23_027324 [Adineta vaga]
MASSSSSTSVSEKLNSSHTNKPSKMMDIEDIVTSPVQTEQCSSLASSIIRTSSAPLPRTSASVTQNPSQTPRRQVVTFKLPGEVDPTIPTTQYVIIIEIYREYVS